MDLNVIVETRFTMTPDGAVWVVTFFGHDFWERYLTVFDRVRVLARVERRPEPPKGAVRADGDQVGFAPLPYYIGPLGYARRYPELRRAVIGAIGSRDAVIARVPSPIGSIACRKLRREGRPYGVEVIGDPYDAFAPGAVRHRLRPLLRRRLMVDLRVAVAGAVAAGYNTTAAQQQRYPCPGFTTYYPGIRLEDDAIVSQPRHWESLPQPATLIFVGSLEQMYKAPDTLIDAVAACVGNGLDLRLVILGDGRHRPELEARAAGLGLGERVRFIGNVTMGAPVRANLDAADLFVLASRADTVPKAMIEAMARGLPCIGSTVGGIPELLPAEDLVPAGDVAALAGKIRAFVTDPARMTTASARNLAKSQEYREEILRARRTALYTHVRETTEQWLNLRQ